MRKKQMELRHTIHRCTRCGRELRSKSSIKRGAGKKCDKKHQAILKGLRELAAYENS